MRSQCATVPSSLLTVINDILDISKLEAGKVDLEIIDFEVFDTVEAAVGLLAPKAHEKGIDLGVFVDPAARGGFRGDETRLRQILLNLVGNAIKFTEQGGVSVEAAVCSDPTQDLRRLRFEIVDTGIGMSEAAHARLFEKFSQADSSITRRFGGSGLDFGNMQAADRADGRRDRRRQHARLRQSLLV